MYTLELMAEGSGYKGKEILHEVSFKADQDSIYVGLGPNGAGKTLSFAIPVHPFVGCPSLCNPWTNQMHSLQENQAPD